jgi:hypothetical protein
MMDTPELRRCALQLASQLPSEKREALAVIRLMRDLIENWAYAEVAREGFKVVKLTEDMTAGPRDESP